jgi:hypothetical protein
MSLTIRNCRFAFKCQQKWDDLNDTRDDAVRFCKECQREVYLSLDDESLLENIRLNRCVAIDDSDGFRLLGHVVYSPVKE